MHSRYTTHDTHWRRFLFYSYPGVKEYRAHIAGLPSSRNCILTVKNTSHDINNAACAEIIKELLDDPLVYGDTGVSVALRNLIIDVCREFYFRLRALEGWSTVLGLPASFKVTVESLESLEKNKMLVNTIRP